MPSTTLHPFRTLADGWGPLWMDLHRLHGFRAGAFVWLMWDVGEWRCWTLSITWVVAGRKCRHGSVRRYPASDCGRESSVGFIRILFSNLVFKAVYVLWLCPNRFALTVRRLNKHAGFLYIFIRILTSCSLGYKDEKGSFSVHYRIYCSYFFLLFESASCFSFVLLGIYHKR